MTSKKHKCDECDYATNYRSHGKRRRTQRVRC